MTPDPLAELLAEMARDLPTWDSFPPSYMRAEADWLREHRTELLEALGGTVVGTTTRKGPSGMAAIHVLGYPDDPDGRPCWLFPEVS